MGLLSQMMTNIYKPAEQKKTLQALPKNLTPAKAAQMAAQTALSQGQLLRGEVMDLRAGQIMVLLENGASVTARTEGTLDLSIGQNAQFLVAQTTDDQILLKHVKEQGSSENPMVDKALQAANITKTDRSVAIVTELLAHQQPVNEAGIRHYLSLSAKHPELPVKDLVLMELHQIPVTKENVEQFLNYNDRNGKLINQTQDMLISLTETMKKLPEGEMKQQFIKEFQTILLNSHTAADSNQNASALQETAQVNSTIGTNAPLASNPQNSGEVQTEAVIPEEMKQTAADIASPEQMTAENIKPEQTGNTNSEPPAGTMENTNADLQPGALHQPSAENSTAHSSFLPERADRGDSSVQDFLNSFLLKPEDIADSEKVRNYYNELSEKIEQLEQLATKLSEASGETASDTPKQMRSNLNFMDAVNQVFPYVQLPLKFRESAAHGELYVYEKKRSLKPSDSLSALLHLELEALGTTDIFVTLTGTHVTTRFSMTDKESSDLIKAELPSLEQALNKSGYTLQSEVTIRDPEEAENTPTLLEQFLEDHAPGGLNRYTFDIRA